MMKLLVSVLIVVGTSTFAVAGKPAAGSEVPAADARKFVVFWDQLVEIVVSDKDACPKMGMDMKAHMDANPDMLKLANDSAATGRQMPKDTQKHLQDTVPKLMPALMSCQKDTAVQAAIQRINVRKKR